MDKPEQSRELFPMRESANERIGVQTEGRSAADISTCRTKKNAANFKRQETVMP